MRLTYDVSKKNLDKDLEMLKKDRNDIIINFLIYVVFTIVLSILTYYSDYYYKLFAIENKDVLVNCIMFIIVFLVNVYSCFRYINFSFSFVDDIKYYLSRRRTINALLVFREFTLNNIKYINQVKFFKLNTKKIKVDVILGDD